MLEKPKSSSSGEDRDKVDVILLNNEIKAGLPVSPSPGSGLALCPDDRGSGFLSEREIERGREGARYGLRLADSTSREQVCSVACLASRPSPDTQGISDCTGIFARYYVTEMTVHVCITAATHCISVWP